MSDVFGPDYSRSYDAFYKEKDYAAEVDLLEEVFDDRGVYRVLDLGCGTGGHVIELMARGYDVVGVDRSPSMLAIARSKAAARGVAPRLLCGDLRSLKLRERFDAVVSMFAVASYQHTDEDVSDMFSVASSHLVDNGIFLFDAWYGPAVTSLGPSDRVLVRDKDDVEIVRISSGKVRADEELCDVRMDVWEVGGGELLSYASEIHTMRFFFPGALKGFLGEAGLFLERLGRFPEINRAPGDDTWNAFVMASKR